MKLLGECAKSPTGKHEFVEMPGGYKQCQWCQEKEGVEEPTLITESERRCFIVHGREYWWTKEKVKTEMGIPPEDIEEVWEQGRRRGHPKTEEERQALHKERYGTEEVPTRGTGKEIIWRRGEEIPAEIRSAISAAKKTISTLSRRKDFVDDYASELFWKHLLRYEDVEHFKNLAYEYMKE